MVKTIAKIEGMSCPMCEAHICDTIRKTFAGAKKISASFKKKEASFLTDEDVDPDKLRKAIEETGYAYVSSESTPFVKKPFWRR